MTAGVLQLPTAPRPDPYWPDPLDEAAYHGVLGEVVRAIEPHTEADPAALLVQLLVGVGNLIGRAPFVLAEADEHHVNLNVLVVADSSKGRKGTSWGHVRRLLSTVDPDWARNCIVAGLSSGEGLIYQVRDPEERAPRDGDAGSKQQRVPDPGASDKRCLVVESEFAGPLAVAKREGNTLTVILRAAWDNGHLAALTKSPLKATAAHVSVIGHITQFEFRRQATQTDLYNGTLNRFLIACVTRSKRLPRGGRIHSVDFGPFVRRLRESVDHARRTAELGWEADADALWEREYDALSEARPGVLGAVTSRAEAQTIRLAGLYALMDCSRVIRAEHLLAALAVWRYCADSAEWLFQDQRGDATEDAIIAAVRRAPGINSTALYRLFGNNRSKGVKEAAQRLEREGLLRMAQAPSTGGRPAERWFPAEPKETNA